jgi:hypothetical protein
VPEADLSSNDEMQRLGKSLGIPLPAVEDNMGSSNADIAEVQTTDTALPLLPDQQGQVQFIGPSSSFSFHLQLRSILGDKNTTREFVMFGRNPADGDEKPEFSGLPEVDNPRQQRAVSTSHSDCNSMLNVVRDVDQGVLDYLIDAYFETIHPDFPVLHEASFREAYEAWSSSNSPTNPTWMCGFICVLLLSRRVVPTSLPERTEQKWWQQVQTSLHSILFASNILAVQALLLAALHLHNTSHRDACWTITGTAVRIVMISSTPRLLWSESLGSSSGGLFAPSSVFKFHPMIVLALL